MRRLARFLILAAGLVLHMVGEKEFADSVRLIPVDNAHAHRLFLAKVMNMTAVGYSGAWTKKSFRDGLNRPAVKSGDAEVIEFVRQTPGAIGYVTIVPDGVLILGKY